jgi:hypothetical protein
MNPGNDSARRGPEGGWTRREGRSLITLVPLGLVLAGVWPGVRPAFAQDSIQPAPGSAPSAAGDPSRHLLDFWIGDWDVYDNATQQRDGRNRIDPVLNGAAIVESWTGVDGHAGMSWFYFSRSENRWKQIWVTDNGGVKEKAQVTGAPAGSIRFRGEIPLRDGRRVLDQTTLTPLSGGRVRQVIEQSLDGGVTWQTVYDANYSRRIDLIPP